MNERDSSHTHDLIHEYGHERTQERATAREKKKCVRVF